MTSPRKITANRENAKRSTGPRSAAGKRKSSKNALRHGLAAISAVTQDRAPNVEQLALAIAGREPSAARLHFAREAAEAEIFHRIVQEKKVEAIAQAMSNPATFAPKPMIDLALVDKLWRILDPVAAAKLGPLAAADAAETRAKFEKTLTPALEHERFRMSEPLPRESDRAALASMAIVSKLRLYERYNARAFARRRRAFKALCQLEEREKAEMATDETG